MKRRAITDTDVKEVFRMSEIIHIRDRKSYPALSLAIGFFDGLHSGHRLLLRECRNSSALPTVLTFSKDWKGVKEEEADLLLTEKEKEGMLRELGIEKELILPFDKETMETSVEDFLSFLLCLNVKKVVVGQDFTFGRYGKGKAANLFSLKEKGIEIEILPLLKSEEGKISTTLIKKLLLNKKMEEANHLLTYPFFYQGKVIHGLHNGHKLGFPTANMELPKEKLSLPKGVYKTRTLIDGKPFPSMTNIGNHPTISPLSKDIAETAIFGLDTDLYGKEIRVEFRSFLREQKSFQSVEALIEQLKKDKEKCINEK